MGPPILDLDAARRAILERLPRQRRWTVGGMPLRYDFSKSAADLVSVAEEVDARWFDEAWRPLVVFGECDYADGGGARPLLTIDRRNGAVVGLDLERDDEPVFPINASLGQFIEMFCYLDAFLASEQVPPDDAERVMRGIDDSLESSDWCSLLEHVRAEA